MNTLKSFKAAEPHVLYAILPQFVKFFLLTVSGKAVCQSAVIDSDLNNQDIFSFVAFAIF